MPRATGVCHVARPRALRREMRAGAPRLVPRPEDVVRCDPFRGTLPARCRVASPRQSRLNSARICERGGRSRPRYLLPAALHPLRLMLRDEARRPMAERPQEGSRPVPALRSVRARRRGPGAARGGGLEAAAGQPAGGGGGRRAARRARAVAAFAPRVRRRGRRGDGPVRPGCAHGAGRRRDRSERAVASGRTTKRTTEPRKGRARRLRIQERRALRSRGDWI